MTGDDWRVRGASVEGPADQDTPAGEVTVPGPVVVRRAQVEDVTAMAHVIVRSWQETYRGLMADDVLDDPGFVAARVGFWTAALTDERYRENRVAVAERGGRVIGVAMSGPAQDAGAHWQTQLYVLYVYAADHGSGAGTALLRWVVPETESAVLWVADPNPRAQAFYVKHGFVADGASTVDEGLRAIRMVRAGSRDVTPQECAPGPPPRAPGGGR